MNLAVYDLTLLGIFVIFLAVFLSRKKKNIQSIKLALYGRQSARALKRKLGVRVLSPALVGLPA